MYNQNQHLAKNAQSALQDHKREQEEHKLALLREQHHRDLKELETKLYYKQQEVARIKAQADRLKRELAFSKSKSTTQPSTDRGTDNKIKQIQSHIIEVEKNIQSKLEGLTRKITEDQVLIESKKREIQTFTQKQKSEQMHTQDSSLQVESQISKVQSHLQETEKNIQTKLEVLTKKITQNQILIESKNREIEVFTQKQKIEQAHTRNDALKVEDQISKTESHFQEVGKMISEKLNFITKKFNLNQEHIEVKAKEIDAWKKKIKEIELKIQSLRHQTIAIEKEQANLTQEKQKLTIGLQQQKSQVTQQVTTMTQQKEREKNQFESKQEHLKEIESKILTLKHETDTLTKEQDNLAREKQKLTVELQQQKNQLTQQLEDARKNAIKNHEKVIIGLEQSMKTFSQEVAVLENKIKALKASMR